MDNQKARIASDLQEMDKPMARSVDDEDRDAHLKAVEREEDPHTAAYIVEAGDTRCLVRQSQEYSGPLGERHFAKKDEGSVCCGARIPVGGGCRYGHNRRGAAVRAEPPPGVS